MKYSIQPIDPEFFVDPKPLTETYRKRISESIKADKAKKGKTLNVKEKRRLSTIKLSCPTPKTPPILRLQATRITNPLLKSVDPYLLLVSLYNEIFN